MMGKSERRCCVVVIFVVLPYLLVLALVRYYYQSVDVPAAETSPRRYADDFEVMADLDLRPRTRKIRKSPSIVGCRMSNCFNATPCRLYGFRVYVYPDGDPPASGKYAEVLRALRSSRYYTEDPERACLFVLSMDTLNRDSHSRGYVRNIQSQIDSLRWWRRGINHVIFNLFAGTWHDYKETSLGFDVGKAILAKASMSRLHYRSGFDVSFPLFDKNLKFRGGEPGALSSGVSPPYRNYLLSFKGKRYLFGLSSETRGSLYHIHNDKDIIMLTTCHHRDHWQILQDERCERDNQEYDRFG